MTVTVCVPVWNGARFVGETLECLRVQTLADIRVLVSVDDSDDDSGSVCRAIESDPRFEVTIQPVRMGWIGNVNSLLRRVETPFGCIVPHDDLVAPDYIRRLVAHLEGHQRAVLAYSDLVTFGLHEMTIVQPELIGDRLNRIVTFLHEHGPAVGFRGVFRKVVLDRGHYLRHDAEGYCADTLWLLALAGEGSLLRVPDVLYRKRTHGESETARWDSRLPRAKVVKWMDHCVACQEVAMAAADWSIQAKQTIAAAALARVTGLCRVAHGGCESPADPAALIALASHYCLRVAGEIAPGASPLDGRTLSPRPRAFSAADPESAEGHLAHSRVLEWDDRLDEAVAAARSAVDLKPDLAAAGDRLANLLARRGNCPPGDG